VCSFLDLAEMVVAGRGSAVLGGCPELKFSRVDGDSQFLW